jgi:hypothetical protein
VGRTRRGLGQQVDGGNTTAVGQVERYARELVAEALAAQGLIYRHRAQQRRVAIVLDRSTTNDRAILPGNQRSRKMLTQAGLRQASLVEQCQDGWKILFLGGGDHKRHSQPLY